MAGKTGTCQTGYGDKTKKLEYIASFAGYFPADEPKYSCIVVIHKPNTSKGYYGNIVAGPVFKKIAQKIYANNPMLDEVPMPQTAPEDIIKSQEAFYTQAQSTSNKIPNLKGMDAMDALTLLENLGAKVVLKGKGKVKEQSAAPGTRVKTNDQITLTLS